MPDVSLETILVAVIAGLGGGLAGTWLQIRHEREEGLPRPSNHGSRRPRTGLQQAIIGLDEAFSVGLKHRYLDAQKDQLVFRHPQTRELAPESEEVFSRARRLIGEARGANRSRLAPLRACLGARPMRHARTDPPRRHADGAGSSGFRVQRLLEGARRSAGVPCRLQQVGPARGAGAPVVAAVAVDPLAETLEPPAAREVPTEGRGAQV